MKLNLGINKRDLLIVIALSIVFLLLAVPNLGATQIPVNTWETNQDQSVYLSFGKVEDVHSVYMLVKNGSANVQVYTGLPQNWTSIGTIAIKYPEYYDWKDLTINRNTEHIRLSFEKGEDSSSTFVEIAEVAIINQENQKITITSVTGENFSDSNFPKLIDEQAVVEVPQTYMTETMFDEIYYVRTAEQYLKLQSPYEWTHPPLGKLILAVGIASFGFNAFGWRIMGVIFAALMIPLIYLLGKKLFGTWLGGFSAAFLLTFDFMHFTMARLATVDTYVVFFSLASQLFFLIYLKNVLKSGWKTSALPLLFAFLFFALGFSTKWIVLYGFLGELAILVAIRLSEVFKVKKGFSAKVFTFLDDPYSAIVGFLLMSIAVYFLTYIPDMLAGRSFIDVFSLQGSMYAYHSTLTATHTFASPWFTWPLMFQPFNTSVHVPVLIYAQNLPDGLKSTVSIMGNPAVWWFGFASIIAILVNYLTSNIQSFRKRKFNFNANLPAIFIIVMFFVQWLPYVLISRVTFIYHFYVNVPFLCLAPAFFITKYWSYKWGKVLTIAYLALVVLMFALFYPVISGMPTQQSSINGLRWIGSWAF